MTDLDALTALAARAIDRVPIQPGDIAPLGARWTLAGGDLCLAMPGPGMRKTGAVAAFAGALADELDHHPAIAIEYPGLKLAIHTHDVKAVTTLDLVYAARLELWLRANGY